MNKKILVLETSVTLQKLFTTTLESDDYTVQFVKDGREAVYQLFDVIPDVFLLNAELSDPRSFEVVRLVRSIPCFKTLAIGMYATSGSPFDEAFATACGADAFVRIEQKTLALNIDELAQIPAQKPDRLAVAQAKKEMDDGRLLTNALCILKEDAVKNAALTELVRMTDSLESSEAVAQAFLSLVGEFCEVPACALYLLENDGPHAYYIAASSMTEKETADFLGVCAADFEKAQADYNIAKLVPKKLDSRADLSRFYTKDVQLSSYESAELESTSGEKLGSVHIVSEGNVTAGKRAFFRYCAKSAGILFEKVIIVKRKIFFEKNIRRAFSRFVPEQIIDDLVAQADTSGDSVAVGEKRTIAILFSDIRSFTSISELNKPEVMVSFLNRYFTIMVNAIKKHGGTIDKFIGDAIMALFGAPVSYEDNARRAVAAACEMRALLPDVPLGDLVLPEGMKFNIGIGIHYGDVTVGSLGSEDKTDYTVIGDSVNLASRLEGLTKTYGTQVLVSESVREDVLKSAEKDAEAASKAAGIAGGASAAGAVAAPFTFRHLDDVRVKGKAKAVPIYAVDRSASEFPPAYKDAYTKGMELYKQGIWNLAKDYFDKALAAVEGDKAAALMQGRCADFIANPPEHWDGAIAFTTK